MQLRSASVLAMPRGQANTRHVKSQSTRGTMQALCEGAMEKLLMCDWAGMSPLEVALCQNAFQTSDPARWGHIAAPVSDRN